MNFFSNIIKPDGKNKAQADALAAAPAEQLQQNIPHNARNAPTRNRTGRTEVYAVRVRENFKGEILRLQAELQLERQQPKGKARKVTEGELVELMLETFKAARRNGEAQGNTVPIANDVWHGVHEIAREHQLTPAQVIEQLVVREVAQLNLVPQRRG